LVFAIYIVGIVLFDLQITFQRAIFLNLQMFLRDHFISFADVFILMLVPANNNGGEIL
jgi:hypothetical protein